MFYPSIVIFFPHGMVIYIVVKNSKQTKIRLDPWYFIIRGNWWFCRTNFVP